MRCPDCDGTGQARGRDLTEVCATCEGDGVVEDDVVFDEDERG